MVETSVSYEFVGIFHRRIGEGSVTGMTASRNGTENGFHRRVGFLGFKDEKGEKLMKGFKRVLAHQWRFKDIDVELCFVHSEEVKCFHHCYGLLSWVFEAHYCLIQ